MEKSFKDNPALQFISGADEEEETAVEETAGAPTRQEPQEKPPEGYKVDPRYIEKKTRRLQLLLQPSLYKKVQKQAKRQKLSVNEYVHRVLEEATGGK